MAKSAIQSQLTAEARDSLTIHKFIYHIIEPKKADSTVSLLTEVVLTETQRQFFQEIILQSAKGTRLKFIDPDNSPFVRECKRIIATPEDFIDASGQLVMQFAAAHDKRMTDGVVIVALVSMLVGGTAQYFISLLKVDYARVMEQTRDVLEPTKVTLREITDSLSENKADIQKRALVDVQGLFSWDVIAVERSKSGQLVDTDGAVGVHFKQFLSVMLMHNDSTYTKNTVAAIHAWSKKEPDLDPVEVKAKTVSYLDANDGQVVSIDSIKDIVCASSSDAIQQRLSTSFTNFMDEKELNGVNFVARKGSITQSERKTKIRTNNGVEVIWFGSKEDAKISETRANGKTTITIVADELTYEN
ncbi:nucleoid-associated protein [Rheinheimera sp.]|uniref:nucleoid-associated protein n=1 Tax=Rheinheimera sp. TaxID=1869214 RepID=UPI0027BA3605|nr:nucleoid-associated protein [Rheinheimera sp.]